MDKTIDHRLAWLAGIIDGEGAIMLYIRALGITPSRKGSGRRKVYHAADFKVEICNTDDSMLAEVLAIADVLGAHTIGGRIGWYSGYRPNFPGRKRLGRVCFTSLDACEAILRAVHPYLVTKRARAEIMLRAIAHRRSYGHCRRPSYVPAAQDQAFVGMVQDMARINHRGAAKEE